ncbi:Acetylesterase [Psilocybe cubensis]|uniref:Acetylesterase n=2 Tax=Psilocybe cubensis TaxID=181762 RepID=A0ACB8H8Y3_PSICU|nr:Acetylesterase [Psilocybe cubensis]KAH9484465.1 Acetylesterase [Psilocybe cubensis]
MIGLRSIFVASLAISCTCAKLAWKDTKFLFTFGDSYTTDGFNISAGVNSPVPGFVSSNGPNWVQALGSTYNVAGTKIFNLASGGATIDSKLVTPFEPTVLSIVDQVAQFHQFLAPKPVGAQWASNNSLFAIWIGINDVGNSFAWTNVSQSQFHTVLMNRLTTQLDQLYADGARSFLFLTVPPTDRAPLILQQGPTAVNAIKPALADYNQQLRTTAQKFQAKHKDINTAIVFDTQPVFNTLLDNAKTFGYVNSTGFCEAYQNGTPSQTTQTPPCAPVSNYFWLNSLHPLFTVHNSLALAISTTLST